ncbi:MAG TPA: hypothetical protein VLL52_01350 [Anaerolineae bacterium]|nr:hypothetical protein [Anaerolineae bacterium]
MYIPDLKPFPSKFEAKLGMVPLAVGWLQGNKPYTTGKVPAGFLEKLALFCLEENSLPGGRRSGRCAVSGDCPKRFKPIKHDQGMIFLDSELRVVGDEDIFAAPAMIYHYITEHQYLPPPTFITAVLNGDPQSTAQTTLLNTITRGL